jgi:conjugal transfer pilus assembly protein TrbC
MINVSTLLAQPIDDISYKDLENPEYMVFISLSMPKHSLQQLYQDTINMQVPLVLRGLKNNSFRDTAAALQELNITAQINPTLFLQYQIQAVPTFVRRTTRGFDSCSGNISFSYAKAKLLENS